MNKVVVVVNKFLICLITFYLYQVEWSAERYNHIVSKLKHFLKQVGFKVHQQTAECLSVGRENFLFLCSAGNSLGVIPSSGFRCGIRPMQWFDG